MERRGVVSFAGVDGVFNGIIAAAEERCCRGKIAQESALWGMPTGSGVEGAEKTLAL